MFKQIFLILILLSLGNSYAQNLAWAQNYGGKETEIVKEVASDAFGNIYLGGEFRDTVDFDLGPGVTQLIAQGNPDVFIMKLDNNGNLIWVKQFAGTNFTRGASLAVDNLGNVYCTGYFQQTTDFDPGTGTTSFTAFGFRDVYVVKLDSQGDLVWAKHIGGADYEEGEGIGVDDLGNVYVYGQFEGTCDFDPSGSNLDLTTSGQDVFILKLNSGGNLVWAKQIGGTNGVDADGRIEAMADGTIYISGTLFGVADFDPNGGVTNLGGATLTYSFVAKYTTDGNLIWAKIYGNAATWGMALAANENIHLTGVFAGTIDFDPGPGVYELDRSYSCVFVSKLDSSGNFIWAKDFGHTPGTSRGYAVAVNSNGDVYTTGEFFSNLDLDPGPDSMVVLVNGTSDTYISALDSNGNFLWGQSFGAESNDVGWSIVTDINENVFATGVFRDTVDFDFTSAVWNLISAPATPFPNSDVYLLKFGDVTGSVDEPAAMSGMTVFPNPTTGDLTISVDDAGLKEILVFNQIGQRMNVTLENNVLDFSSYPNGIYFVQILSEEQRLSAKVIKY